MQVTFTPGFINTVLTGVTILWVASVILVVLATLHVEPFEKFLDGRQGAPLTSAVRVVAGDTGMADYRVRELLTAQFIVAGSNIFNRRR